VVEASDGKARLLATNRNLLVVADILVVNRGFAREKPETVAGLVAGLLEGNRMVRDNPTQYLDTIAKAFKWDRGQAKSEMAKVHLSNLPENQAFFSGAIDAAGSFGGIYQSAVYAYGRDLVPSAPDAERFTDLRHLEALQKAGAFADQKVAIAPLKSDTGLVVENNPLLSKDIRFFFLPNSFELDMANEENLEKLKSIKELLKVSPGSTLLLRGHVDDAEVAKFRVQGGEAFVRKMALKAMELSKNRANTIRRLLEENHKVDVDRLNIAGRGWDEPISKDSDENRRVEVQWFLVE